MIKINNVKKSYGSNIVLDGASIEIKNGEIVLVSGPSGEGKTTLLRLIAGLEMVDSGTIEMDCKKISFAFQNNLILENLNVFDNISYGLDHREYSKEEIKEKVENISHLFECDSFLYQRARTLSGGQKQRVSLARAFIKNPDLMLIDEAFNSLDKELKDSLLNKVLELQNKNRFTLLYISHDERDEQMIPGRVIFIENGQIKTKD